MTREEYLRNLKAKRHATLSNMERMELLYGKMPLHKRPAIKKMIINLGLVSEDEESAEFNSTEDILKTLNELDKKQFKTMVKNRNNKNKGTVSNGKAGNGRKPVAKKNEVKKVIHYLEGVRVFHPHENAPDFVKAEFVMSPKELFAFLKASPEFLHEHETYGKQLKCTLKESTGGNLYLEINTYGLQIDDSEGETAPESDDMPF